MTSSRTLPWLVAAGLLFDPAPSWSQPARQPAPSATVPVTSAPSAWTWAVDLNAFGGYNYQRREFTDFDAWESQN